MTLRLRAPRAAVAVLLLWLCVGCQGAVARPRCFDDDFMFGSATAAYQVEGGWNESGREPSIWDAYCRATPAVACADVADDFFHRFRDDVARMGDMGMQSFRFSVSWSRAMTWDPLTRRMQRNPAGLAFYHALLDELAAHRIEPILTIYHGDLPLALQTELSPGGWLHPAISDHFAQYASLLFREFGARVAIWATINEPHMFASMAYCKGEGAPGVQPAADSAYVVGHNLLLAHAKAVRTFRDLKLAASASAQSAPISPHARIGMVLAASYYYPLNPRDSRDVDAATRGLEFDVGWFLEPLLSGDYPASMKKRAGDRLPSFTRAESALIRGSYDVLMLNHYLSRAVTDCGSANSTTSCQSLSPGWEFDRGLDDSHLMPGSLTHAPDPAGSRQCELYSAYPPGYLATIRWLHSKDRHAPILLTENGWCGNGSPESATQQLEFFKLFLEQVYIAVTEHRIPIIGYTAWSLLDNYEWGSYAPRFGLFEVKFPSDVGVVGELTPGGGDLTRVARPAASWFAQLAKTKCLPTHGAYSSSEASQHPPRNAYDSGDNDPFNWVLVIIGVVLVLALGTLFVAVSRYIRRLVWQRGVPPEELSPLL